MTANKCRLLVIDIDGTLINKDSTISADNKKALIQVSDRGITVALSTGRTIKSCRKIFEQLLLDGYHIFFDGALVSDCVNSRHVHISPIEKLLVKEVIEYAHAHDIDLGLASAGQYFTERETWLTEIKRSFFDVEATIGNLYLPCESEEIIRLDTAVSDHQEQVRAERFMNQFTGRLHFSLAHSPHFPEVTFINIITPGTSKGEALRSLANYLRVPLKEVVAVGDWINDIPLLTTAGLGIAMGNAHDDLKAIADHITLGVEENGLAAAIREFIL